MSSLGLGVMIKMLSGNKAAETIRPYIGKTITSLEMVDNRLRFLFGDDGFALFDDGQSCCERRYMTCDDDLSSFVGDSLVDIELRGACEGCEEHELQFVVVQTNRGSFTVANHNEHNGYYGGFAIAAVRIGSEA